MVERRLGGGRLPDEVRQLWSEVGGLRVFEDVTYGQFGLILVGPARALELTELVQSSRSSEVRNGDLILGEFLGESDFLLIRTDPHAEDYGSLFLLQPIDGRADWPRVGTSLYGFLETFLASEGAKPW